MSAMRNRGQFRNSCVINPTELLRFLSGSRSRSLDAVAVCSLLVGSAEMANQSVPSRSAAAAMTATSWCSALVSRKTRRPLPSVSIGKGRLSSPNSLQRADPLSLFISWHSQPVTK